MSCKKPDCDCIEQYELKHGEPPKYGYPCLHPDQQEIEEMKALKKPTISPSIDPGAGDDGFYCQSDYDGRERCTAICDKCTPKEKNWERRKIDRLCDVIGISEEQILEFQDIIEDLESQLAVLQKGYLHSEPSADLDMEILQLYNELPARIHMHASFEGFKAGYLAGHNAEPPHGLPAEDGPTHENILKELQWANWKIGLLERGESPSVYLNAQIIELKKELASVKNGWSACADERREFYDKIQRLSKDITDLKNELDAANLRATDTLNRLLEVEAERNKLQAERDDYQERLESIKQNAASPHIRDRASEILAKYSLTRGANR
jgi:hypothetical protein